MATRIVFSDMDNNEMDCYVNDKGRLYVGISQRGEDIAGSGYITLDKEDVKQLIKILTDAQKEMQ